MWPVALPVHILRGYKMLLPFSSRDTFGKILFRGVCRSTVTLCAYLAVSVAPTLYWVFLASPSVAWGPPFCDSA